MLVCDYLIVRRVGRVFDSFMQSFMLSFGKFVISVFPISEIQIARSSLLEVFQPSQEIIILVYHSSLLYWFFLQLFSGMKIIT